MGAVTGSPVYFLLPQNTKANMMSSNTAPLPPMEKMIPQPVAPNASLAVAMEVARAVVTTEGAGSVVATKLALGAASCYEGLGDFILVLYQSEQMRRLIGLR